MKEIKKYNFSIPPRKGSVVLNPIVWMSSRSSMKRHKFHIQKAGMEGLKPPYILLCGNKSFYGNRLMRTAVFPHRVNCVATIGEIGHSRFIMRKLGYIVKRDFLPEDKMLMRNIKYSLQKNGGICVLFPESSKLDGKRSCIPQSIAKLCLELGVPVVTLNMHGCFTANPQFNQKKYNHVPLRAEMKQVVKKEEIDKISQEEIISRIISNLEYDDYKYQRENKIRITDPERAKGLSSLLYQCPHCYTEHAMIASGKTLRCQHCGKAYEYTELGEMRALDGETEFSHIPDWFDWQRQNVRREVESGKYYFEDEVEVWTLPNAKKFYPQGKGKIVHTVDGFKLTCRAYDKDVEEFWKGEDTYGCHIEYNFRKKADVIDISKVDESYWLYPTKKDVITKISIAFEEIFKFKSKNDLLR